MRYLFQKYEKVALCTSQNYIDQPMTGKISIWDDGLFEYWCLISIEMAQIG
jgi:hypothetical protein